MTKKSKKIIFLGTDLHGDATELASKTVGLIKKTLKDYVIVSIENRKSFEKQDKTIIIKKKFNGFLRKVLQYPFLISSFIKLKKQGYQKVCCFWVAKTKFHEIFFKFLKKIGFEVYFVIISGEDTDFNKIKSCDKIICQSKKMLERAKLTIDNHKLYLVYPFVDLSIFKPDIKETDLVIPSIPYDPEDFKDRGIDIIKKIINIKKVSGKIIFRSKESYLKFSGLKNRKIKLINKSLKDEELNKIISKCRIMPLLYQKSPDMPLSGIEGISSGCVIICSNKVGLSEIIKKHKIGFVLNDTQEFFKNFEYYLNQSKKIRQEDIRIVAEKYFDSNKNIKEFLNILEIN